MYLPLTLVPEPVVPRVSSQEVFVEVAQLMDLLLQYPGHVERMAALPTAVRALEAISQLIGRKIELEGK